MRRDVIRNKIAEIEEGLELIRDNYQIHLMNSRNLAL